VIHTTRNRRNLLKPIFLLKRLIKKLFHHWEKLIKNLFIFLLPSSSGLYLHVLDLHVTPEPFVDRLPSPGLFSYFGSWVSACRTFFLLDVISMTTAAPASDMAYALMASKTGGTF